MKRYTTKELQVFNGITTLVFTENDEQVGRIVPCGAKYQARHSYRHSGGLFRTHGEALEYVIAVDLAIEAQFTGQVQVVSGEVAA